MLHRPEYSNWITSALGLEKPPNNEQVTWLRWPELKTKKFLNSSSYWSSGTIQSLFSLDQMKQFILASGSVPDQGTNESSSSLYNPPHRGESISSPDPYTLSEHLTNTIVDVSPSGARLLILPPSGAKLSVYIDSCFSSLENKPWTYWLPLGENHSSKSWSSYPWSWN